MLGNVINALDIPEISHTIPNALIHPIYIPNTYKILNTYIAKLLLKMYFTACSP